MNLKISHKCRKKLKIRKEPSQGRLIFSEKINRDGDGFV
jgi:hypothetical protein